MDVPSRNVIKTNLPESYYHVYARGISKQKIFAEEADYLFFLSLFNRYLSKESLPFKADEKYQKLNDLVEVLSYCLMPNHFHILIYQIDEAGMSKLMHGVMTSYSRYFNIKYKRSGPLLESRYKASCILFEEYLLHITRYIHLNPEDWVDYPHSSLRAYLYDDGPSWLNKKRIIELYGSSVKYFGFLKDDKNSQDTSI